MATEVSAGQDTPPHHLAQSCLPHLGIREWGERAQSETTLPFGLRPATPPIGTYLLSCGRNNSTKLSDWGFCFLVFFFICLFFVIIEVMEPTAWRSIQSKRVNVFSQLPWFGVYPARPRFRHVHVCAYKCDFCGIGSHFLLSSLQPRVVHRVYPLPLRGQYLQSFSASTSTYHTIRVHYPPTPRRHSKCTFCTWFHSLLFSPNSLP